LDKAPDAFRTISEVADEINVPQHVLRFWESRFVQIRPLKRGGGRRYYRPDDVNLLRGVRHLLYGEGYTIRGVQRILREEGVAFVQNVWRPGVVLPAADPEDLAEGPERELSRPDAEPLLFDPAQGTDAERSDTRREPTIVPPRRAVALDNEDRRKLQTTLDDLITCRKLIEAALADNTHSGD
jgi:DNA-binding transcriptional MerR regulator